MTNQILTLDFSEFGKRELDEAITLLSLYKEGKFYKDQNDLDSHITINFNRNSGYVFLSDENYIVYMANNDNLEKWLTCSYCGHEGLQSEIEEEIKENHLEDENYDFPCPCCKNVDGIMS